MHAYPFGLFTATGAHFGMTYPCKAERTPPAQALHLGRCCCSGGWIGARPSFQTSYRLPCRCMHACGDRPNSPWGALQVAMRTPRRHLHPRCSAPAVLLLLQIVGHSLATRQTSTQPMQYKQYTGAIHLCTPHTSSCSCLPRLPATASAPVVVPRRSRPRPGPAPAAHTHNMAGWVKPPSQHKQHTDSS